MCSQTQLLRRSYRGPTGTTISTAEIVIELAAHGFQRNVKQCRDKLKALKRNMTLWTGYIGSQSIKSNSNIMVHWIGTV